MCAACALPEDPPPPVPELATVRSKAARVAACVPVLCLPLATADLSQFNDHDKDIIYVRRGLKNNVAECAQLQARTRSHPTSSRADARTSMMGSLS